MTLLNKRSSELSGAFTCPAKRGLRVTPCDRVYQQLKIPTQRGVVLVNWLAPATHRTNSFLLLQTFRFAQLDKVF